MHELSIMNSIIDIVLEYAEEYNVKRVNKINLKIGALSDIIPEWAQSYFDMLSKDTVADKAELIIDKIEARIKCRSCGDEYTLKNKNLIFTCNRCGSLNIDLLSGRELSITSIDVD
ncbi:MAG: hydrogenase maturation nickel metallochaperone HypA [Spirochaetota bacterium]|nr:hydrogenase maturation nickel metallochaperone HypA [Spirochaetota bacterium]